MGPAGKVEHTTFALKTNKNQYHKTKASTFPNRLPRLVDFTLIAQKTDAARKRGGSPTLWADS